MRVSVAQYQQVCGSCSAAHNVSQATIDFNFYNSHVVGSEFLPLWEIFLFQG
uniref:Uncharacterized protein n=1 Tax=Arundo donax TaxID=35708 RepID=A0A0A9GA18_ARUDO